MNGVIEERSEIFHAMLCHSCEGVQQFEKIYITAKELPTSALSTFWVMECLKCGSRV